MPHLAASIAEFRVAAEHRTEPGAKQGRVWVIEGNAVGLLNMVQPFWTLLRVVG